MEAFIHNFQVVAESPFLPDSSQPKKRVKKSSREGSECNSPSFLGFRKSNEGEDTSESSICPFPTSPKEIFGKNFDSLPLFEVEAADDFEISTETFDLICNFGKD